MEYTLYKNNFKRDEDSFIGRPINCRNRDLDDLIDRIKGFNSTLSPSETKSIIKAYWDNVSKFIGDGEEYRDNFISVRLGISGSFDSESDRFDKERHNITVKASVSGSIKKSVDTIHTEYVAPDTDLPVIHQVYDWNSETEDQKVSSEGVVEIHGDNLKIDMEYTEYGIFFINTESNIESKAVNIRTNLPKTLVFKAPTLDAGTYKIEIRNAPRNSRKERFNIDHNEYTVE
ncbi:MAG: DNA-binding domain-containing protein [Bacteroidales bacterium]